VLSTPPPCIDEKRTSTFSILPLCLCRSTRKQQLEKAMIVTGARIDDDSFCPLYGNDTDFT
jgi:hypothetical protein